MTGLSNPEIAKIVHRYIGVFNGYLGDFSYRTHTDFYPEYCDLAIDPNSYEGTTRERFIQILKESPPDVQAKIVRGVLERFPVNAYGSIPTTRTQQLFDELLEIIKRLEEISLITSPDLKITSVIVERAITDVEALINTNGAISGVDRIHTALHGYLQAVCKTQNIPYQKDDNITRLFKLLRQQHPKLQNLGARSQDIERVFNSFASILDALTPIRNNASVAHPNIDLLEKAEAILVINATRTMLHYLDSKLSQ
jgi:hypothetical protein